MLSLKNIQFPISRQLYWWAETEKPFYAICTHSSFFKTCIVLFGEMRAIYSFERVSYGAQGRGRKRQ